MKLFNLMMSSFIYNRSKVNEVDSLDEKINYFISWCSKNGTDYDVRDIKSIIDKVTVWYELRYPDSYLDQEDIDSVMFNSSNSSNNQEWGEFYTFDKFYYSLSKKEKELLNQPCFVDMIYLNNGRSHIHLNEDGSISDASDIILFDRFRSSGNYLCTASELLDGKSLDEWPNIMKENKINANYIKINNIINNYKKRVSIKEGLFDTIMYNIVERDGKFYGPRRGVLFAREFDRDIKVPVSYGDSSLALEYLANGGDDSLLCFSDYFEGGLEKKTIKEVLTKQNLVGLGVKQKRKFFPKSCE